MRVYCDSDVTPGSDKLDVTVGEFYEITEGTYNLYNYLFPDCYITDDNGKPQYIELGECFHMVSPTLMLKE